MTQEEIDRYAQMAIDRGGTAGGAPRELGKELLADIKPPLERRKKRPHRSLLEESYTAPATWLVSVYTQPPDNGRFSRQQLTGAKGQVVRKVHRCMAKQYAALAEFVAAVHAEPRRRVVVKLTRLGPRHMDYGNLVGALKNVQDAVADRFGVDDGRVDLVSWRFKQRNAKKHGVEITVRYPFDDTDKDDGEQ
jgi:hypothetical protein